MKEVDAKKVALHVVDWLDQYAANAGITGFVIGVSGGIDSAVTSALCAGTGRPTYVVEMPIHQHASEEYRSSEHIAWLTRKYANVTRLIVDLTGPFDHWNALLPEVDLDKCGGLMGANARARLRMMTLYALAAQRESLVVGTGNKVEDFGVGFYTKYGDGGVDISPIADLMKSEVFALGRELGIVESILKAAPTDGLWGDSRTDEDQLGATYPELEWAMEFDSRSVGSESELTQRQREVLAIYRMRHRANRHKMVPIPVCRIPDDLKYRG